jgi:hypothetical protein
MKTLKYLAPMMLSLLVSVAQAKSDPTATCKIETDGIIEVYEFYNPHSADSYVKIKTVKAGEQVSEEQLPASFRFTGWIMYGGMFKRNGILTTYEFSNYMSPSIGVLKTPTEKKSMNCVLHGEESAAPEEPQEVMAKLFAISEANECYSNKDCPTGYRCKIIWSPEPFRCVPIRKP